MLKLAQARVAAWEYLAVNSLALGLWFALSPVCSAESLWLCSGFADNVRSKVTSPEGS